GSWPDWGATATPGSLRPSAVVAAGVPEVALAPVAAGVVTAGVVAAGVVSDEALAFDWWSIFSVRGTWNASTPSRITPPTAANTFWRFALALGSNFFFAISCLRPALLRRLRSRPRPPNVRSGP